MAAASMKRAGKSDRKRGAGDGDAALFERLAHHFEDVALKFGQLVEEQDAVVAERDFAGTRDGAAADQSGVADGVVRRAKRPRAHQAARIFEHAGDAVDARGLDGFLERHRRQDGGNALGQHGLAGAGRPEENNVVAAGAGDFQRALGALLSANVAQVHRILRGFGEQRLPVDVHGLEGFRRIDQIHRLRQRFHGEHLHAFDHGGFAGVGFGHDQRANPCSRAHSAAGKRAAHRSARCRRARVRPGKMKPESGLP